jgi:general secretion pathway protein A
VDELMYEQFFGFRERPFDLTPNPRFLCLTARHREALSNLKYAISSRKGLTVLLGEAGTGKTTLIRAALAAQNAPETLIATVQNPVLTRPEFVTMLSLRFGLNGRSGESKAVLLHELEQLLLKRREQGHLTGLVVDEAHALSDDLLEEVRLMANIETDEEKLLPVILVGQPELAERLNSHAFRQLKQRISLRCELGALNVQETADYIACRIRIAGGSPAGVFTREAVTLLYDASRGIPRVVNTICDNALLNAFAAGERPVSSKMIEAVLRDFDLAPGRQGKGGEMKLARSDGQSPASAAGQASPGAVADAPGETGEAGAASPAAPRRRILSFF